MSLTADGLKIKRLPEILTDSEEALKLALGTDIDTSSNSVLGILNSIIGASEEELYQLAQALYDSRDVNTATGKQLDDIVAYVGVSRLDASPTAGNIEFTGDANTIIPAGSLFSDINGNSYDNPANITLTSTACTNALIGINTVAATTEYTITIEGAIYNYTSGSSPTTESIVNGIVALIGAQSAYTVTKEVASGDIQIASNTVLDSITVNVSDNLIVNQVTSLGYVENTVTGAIKALAETITSIDSGISGLDSVNNPVALTLGRAKETDEELRVRHKTSVQIAGTGTVAAIQATLRQLQGVTQALVIENRTNVTDGAGRPPKSYECVVEGAEDTVVATTIWETKPAGIELYGNTSVTVQDVDGNSHLVNFSRPEKVHIWVKVEYSLYDEESFPSDGVDTIKAEIEAYGNNLPLGEDVIPKRMYGTVYGSVTGIEGLVVKVASSGDDPNTEPSAGAFLETSVDILGSQVSDFNTSRIEVTEV